MADTKTNITGSEAVIRCLMEEGVDTMFGYPGGAIMPVYDAMMSESNTIKHILTRHEQGAIHAAQAYARVSGKVGVCIATSGPGATNLITGLADAMIDSTPLVCITGQVAAHLLGTDAFQETDVIGISMPVTKWNYQITIPEEIPEILARAFYLARSGRPGPVVIDIAKNAQFGKLDYSYEKSKGIRSYRPNPKIDTAKVDAAAELINNAKKPYVVYGQGIILSGAEKELDQFLTKTGIPAGWTILGHSALDSDHPMNMGMLGMHGNYGPNIKTNECDVLIAIGMRFDDRVTGDVKRYANQAKVIHIEIDPAEIDKIIKTDVAILGDAKGVLTQLIEKVNKNSHEAWIQEFKDCYEIEYNKVIKDDIYPTKEGLTMGEVIKQVSDATKGNAILVTDVGQHQMVAHRYFRFKQSRSNVTSGGLGTMGFGLPAAMGAKLGAPERTVISVSGDGGFQMTIQELGTIRQENLNIKIIILNNKFLGMVRQWQQLFFEKRYSFTKMVNPDFIKVGEGYGIDGKRIVSRNQLEDGVKEMLEHDGPFILEVSIEKEDNVFPMVPTGASVSEIMLSPEG
jgi:acetolactate synthase I/II/III large subunit